MKTKLENNEIGNESTELFLQATKEITNSIGEIQVHEIDELVRDIQMQTKEAVSQQTAAASTSVNETTNHQMEVIDTLNNLSIELGERAQALGQAVDKFVVE